MEFDFTITYWNYCLKNYKNPNDKDVFFDYLEIFLSENPFSKKGFYKHLIDAYVNLIDFDDIKTSVAKLILLIYPKSIFFKLICLGEQDELSIYERNKKINALFEDFKLERAKNNKHKMDNETFFIYKSFYEEFLVCNDFSSLKEVAYLFYKAELDNEELYWFSRLYIAIEEFDDEYFLSKIEDIYFPNFPGFKETLKTLYLIKKENFDEAIKEAYKLQTLNTYLFRVVALRIPYIGIVLLTNFNNYKKAISDKISFDKKLMNQAVLAIQIIIKSIYSSLCPETFWELSINKYLDECDIKKGSEEFTLLLLISEFYNIYSDTISINTIYDNLIGRAHDLALPKPVFKENEFSKTKFKNLLSSLMNYDLISISSKTKTIKIKDSLLILANCFFYIEERKLKKVIKNNSNDNATPC